ncbi:hypothetical protein PI124_g15044 [Phytophthora idaei]|nr:hypothetical protein PI125_g14658 [Phytophthora idaei]KAG3240040.1 hypothetical protein PI124_g15044 [Phytophthora idaei]
MLMDASDLGLCAVFPAKKEFVQVKFDEDEGREIAPCKERQGSFDINV